MITYHLLSCQGSRNNNEDCVRMSQNEDSCCFVLCDGLGGHGGGEVASAMAAEAAIGSFQRPDLPACSMESISDAFLRAQAAVMDGQRTVPGAEDMKTTMVVLQADERYAVWGHVGDSRLYCFKGGRLDFQTLDHSVPQMLVAAGQLRPSQIRNHPDRSHLLRVIGTNWDEPMCSVHEEVTCDGDMAFLLCSDGFWELIDERQMEKCLKKAKDPKEWMTYMEFIVQKKGRGKNMDNYSAIAVWIREEGAENGSHKMSKWPLLRR